MLFNVALVSIQMVGYIGTFLTLKIIYMYKKKEFPSGAFFICMTDNIATFFGALALKMAMENG